MRNYYLALFSLLSCVLACGEIKSPGGPADAASPLDAPVDTASMYSLTVVKNGNGSGIVASSPAAINCGANCVGSYTSGTAVTLTATPDPGTVFLGWLGDDCTGIGPCSLVLTRNTTVIASFALNNSVVVTLAGAGNGTVTSAPAGINCGTTCSGSFPSGTVVTLTASAATGSTFTGWSGGACSGVGTCVTTVTSAVLVTATFTLQRLTMAVTRSGNGVGTVTSGPAGINCGTNCTASFDYNQVVTLTAVPTVGSAFTGWSGGGCSGTGTCTVTMLAANTVNAAFTLQQFVLMVAKSGAGVGTVTSAPAGINCGATCASAYDYNTSVVLTAVPTVGSAFAGWSGGGCAGTGTCTTTVTAATSVTANFSACPGSGSQTFAFTGTSATFTVPACKTSIALDVEGAQGAAGSGGAVGGLGGRAQGTLAVTPGQVLTIVVGGQNGFNGGGAPGGGPGPASGNGGGRSDVRTSSGAVLIVGGGGGGGSGVAQGTCGSTGAPGGAAGGLTGSDGTDGPGCGVINSHGVGGTQINGGTGGAGRGNCSTTGGNGASGSALLGGAGGVGVAPGAGCTLGFSGSGGGGGGGGWFGGGGGGGGAGGGAGAWAGGGGGGGSSFTGSLASPVTQVGVRSGNGTVIISW